MRIGLIFILLIIFISCSETEQYGLWMSSDNQEENYTIMYIAEESIELKQIVDWNYWLFNENIELLRTSKSEFRNDSMLVHFNQTDKIAKLFLKDSLLAEIEVKRIRELSPGLQKEVLKESINSKALSYKIGKLNYETNIIDKSYTINVLDTINKNRIESLDIFEIGNETFLVLDTGWPFPMQLKYENDEIINAVAYYGEYQEDVTIKKSMLPESQQIQNGKWSTLVKSEDAEEKRIFVEIDSQQFISAINSNTDTTRFQLLSDKKHIVLIPDKGKIVKLRIDSISQNEILIEDYRRRRHPDFRKLIYNRVN